MKIVYYTTGLTGWGRIARGVSIVNALKRSGIECSFTLLSSFQPEFPFQGISHVKIPVEHEDILLGKKCRDSILYNTLLNLNPDFILFDLVWHMSYNFIQDFKCKKIFICRQISDKFFSIPIPGNPISFDSSQFDLLFSIEPFKSSVDMQQLNPFIIRNRDEIFSREEALTRLNLNTEKPNCLIAYNGEPGEFEQIKKQYSYLEDMNYTTTYSTNYSDSSIFPVVDYFNAFDFVVTGAGYNSFWEMIYFNKEGVCVPFPRNFEDQRWRVDNCQEFYIEENGADQLVDIIVNM